MRSKDFDGMVCPIAGVLAAIGDRWALLILRDLVCGLSRYEDLRRSSGVTNATLSDRLKHLEHTGLIEKRRYQVKPERFEYALTDKGRMLAPLMPVLAHIGHRLGVSGASAPPMRFVHRATGADVAPRFVDQRTGELVDPGDLAIEPGPGADELVHFRLSKSARRDDRANHTRPARRTKRGR